MYFKIVIDVPNVDDHLSKIEAAGSKVVMPKMQVGDFGHEIIAQKLFDVISSIVEMR